MIDAHAHLTDARFGDEIDAVIARATEAGVERILTCGEDPVSSERAVELAQRYPSVRAAVGIHPHLAATADAPALRRIGELARERGVVAIGEIGIDLSGRSAPRVDQERAFAAQLELALDLDLPVCIHVRDAGPLVRAVLATVRHPHGYVHCYSEGPDEVDKWMRLGLLISFAGTVTYPRSDALRTAGARVPADRLLVETDAPYLAPQRWRGRRNEPAYVSATYDEVARVRGIASAELAARVRDNAASLFGNAW